MEQQVAQMIEMLLNPPPSPPVNPFENIDAIDSLEIPFPIRFLSTVNFSELPETPVLYATVVPSTLSVLNVTRVKLGATSPGSLTDFTNGADGQTIYVVGDGNTTITHGTKIVTNTGANKLLANNSLYIFIRVGTVWIELASPATLVAGAGLSLTGNTLANRYIGKQVPLLANTLALTSSTGFVPFPAPALVNTLNMNNVRVSLFSDSPSFVEFLTQYSLDGVIWNNIIPVSGMTNFGGQVYHNGTAVLPNPAKAASVWFRPAYNGMGAGTNFTVSGFHLEFTP